MKHVFLIGAHTPYLTSIGVIHKKRIPLDDVIFVYGRNYKCDLIKLDVQSFDISNYYYIYYRGNTRSKILKHIRWIDDFISSKIADKYTLYIPHLSFDIFQLFATHRLCCDIKFIQEGIVDFCVPKGSRPKFSLLDFYIRCWLLRGTRTWKTAGWNEPAKTQVPISETFSITNSLFNLMECTHTIITWPIVNTGIIIDPQNPIFVFESAVERNDVEKGVFMDSVKLLVKKYAGGRNYVKYHPSQSKSNIEEIESIFKNNGFEIERLPDNIPFELLLCSQKKFKVCGFTTSLVYYAKLMGHEAHICGPSLLRSKKFAVYWNQYIKRITECYGDLFNYENL